MGAPQMLLRLGSKIKNLAHSTLDDASVRSILADLKQSAAAYKASLAAHPHPPASVPRP